MTNTILNATQHDATADQQTAGVTNLPPAIAAAVRNNLTVDSIPTHNEIVRRCTAIALLLEQHNYDNGVPNFGQRVMIGGAPWMMSFLEAELWSRGFTPVYAFSVRASEEVVDPTTGIVRKTNVFKHVGFVEARKP